MYRKIDVMSIHHKQSQNKSVKKTAMKPTIFFKYLALFSCRYLCPYVLLYVADCVTRVRLLSPYRPYRTQSMHRIELKKEQRNAKIADLNQRLGKLTDDDRKILDYPLRKLHGMVLSQQLRPQAVWNIYTKSALQCHQYTNCLTELVDFVDSDSLQKIHGSQLREDKARPLAGVPVSIKDNFGIGGYDASMGFIGRCFQPVKHDSSLIRLLRDAGAILYTKTNVPAGMMSILSTNPVWGTTRNPKNMERSPGGSSSGEAALIAGGGSRVGVGTDIGGSVRIPAHFCGIYSIRMSYNRFPRAIIDDASTPGFEGIPDVASPLARTMDDLRFFIEQVMSMKPWEYCYQLLPIPWKVTPAAKPKRVGYLRSDQFLVPTPAVERALDIVLEALKADRGIELVEFNLPQPGNVYDEALASLLLADGMETVAKPLLWGEKTDVVITAVRMYARIKKWIRWILEWGVAHILRQPSLAAELSRIGPNSATEYYRAVVWRERLRSEFWEAWRASQIDVLLLPPYPSPALPIENLVPDSCCNFAAIFNLLDYPAGIIPVTTVDAEKDKLQISDTQMKSLNWQSQSYLRLYDSHKMSGLPVGIQIVGQRLHDEQVLSTMEYIDNLLK